jgi:hypothetical protein
MDAVFILSLFVQIVTQLLRFAILPVPFKISVQAPSGNLGIQKFIELNKLIRCQPFTGKKFFKKIVGYFVHASKLQIQTHLRLITIFPCLNAENFFKKNDRKLPGWS